MRKKAGKAVIYFLVLMLCCTVAARAASSITISYTHLVSASDFSRIAGREIVLKPGEYKTIVSSG